MSIFLECEFIDLRFDVSSLDALPFFQSFIFNFVIEVSNVSNDSVVFHFGHVLGFNDVFISCGGNENVHLSNNIFNSDDFITLHTGLKGTDGINLSNIDSSAWSCHWLTTSFSDITETEDQNFLSTDHDISGSVQTVDQRVFASVNVVEFGLGDAVVNVDEGTNQFSLWFQFVKSGNTGCGFFGNSFKVFGEFAEEFRVGSKTVVDGFEKIVFIFGKLSTSGYFSELSGFFEQFFFFQTINAKKGGISSVIDNKLWAFSVFPK